MPYEAALGMTDTELWSWYIALGQAADEEWDYDSWSFKEKDKK